MFIKSYIGRNLVKLQKKIHGGFKVQKGIQTEKYGTKYGNWCIPANYLNKDSICYLAGVGEDVSFDIELAQNFGCKVYLFDPTPRAKDHFEKITYSILNNQAFSPTGSLEYTYKIDKEKLILLNFIEYGLWNTTDELKFFAPQNESHVSHSILNLQNTTHYFVAKVKPVHEFMQQFNHTKIHLLKLDIEGAEYAVIDSVLDNKIPVDIFCIEFDEAHTPKSFGFLNRISNYVKKILDAGYILIDQDEDLNMTFMKKQNVL